MLTVKRPLGFGTDREVAEFFGVSVPEVKRKAAAGEWPSYVIAGRRVFNMDELLDLLVAKQPEATQ